MKSNIQLFISIYIIITQFHICVNLEDKWQPPNDLRKIEKIYESFFRVSSDQPVITYSYVYYISDGLPKVFNYKDLGLFSSAKVFNLFGNSYIKPLLYINTPLDFYSIFFTKGCYIYVFIESGKNTCNKENQICVLKFENMGKCYDSLRIYYDTETKDAAVYNYKSSKKVRIFNLYDIDRYSVDLKINPANFKIFLEVESKYDVVQSLIYPYETNKSILIIIDHYGIRFHNLRGKNNIFFDTLYNGRLIQEYNSGCEGIADFIGGNKLLYIFFNKFVVFELKEFKIIDIKNNFISGENVECLLGLKDGNNLVGTRSGNIYLIGCKNQELTILDQRKICDERIISLSYINSCLEGTSQCYKFAANCGGYLFIFEIGVGDYYSLDSNSKIVNLRIIFFLFILFSLL